MRRTCLLFLGGLFLLLSACAPNPSDGTEDSRTQIVATTYPVYLFACEVTRGVPDCTVTLMIDQPIGCLHDYTLTVKDMKALERADIIVCNGAGLEESMESALETVGDTPQIDCAQGIPLLEGEDAGHHHEGESSLPAMSMRRTPTFGWTLCGPAPCWRIWPAACPSWTRTTRLCMPPTRGWQGNSSPRPMT